MDLDTLIEKFKKDRLFDCAFVLWLIFAFISLFVIWIANRYLTFVPMLIIVLFELVVLALLFLLTIKKTKIGAIVNGVLAILMIISLIPIIRVSDFFSRITNNFEEDHVSIITSTTSGVEAEDDFVGYRIAIVKDDSYTTWGWKVLEDHEKTNGLIKVDFKTFEEAYAALQKDDIDLMIYSDDTASSLEETEQFAGNLKHNVLFSETKRIEIEELNKVDINKSGFTVLVSGVDLSGNNINKKGRSDVIMLVTVNPNTKKVHIQSVPRDTYAALPCRGDLKTKMNRSGSQGGIDCTIATVEKYFDIDINYYVKINFTGFTDLIDSLGGIEAYSQYTYCADGYCFNEGMNEMDGAKALIFARIRKILPENDVSRGKNQIEIIKGIINKFSQNPSYERMMDIMGAIEDNFVTSFNEKDFVALFNMFMNMKDDMEITSDSIKGEIFWDFDPIYHTDLYYYQPYEGEKELVKERIENIIYEK